MGAVVDQELKGVLTYYGEKLEGPDTPKPEDFFGMILSFSSSLQVRCPTYFSQISQICVEMRTGNCRQDGRTQTRADNFPAIY